MALGIAHDIAATIVVLHRNGGTIRAANPDSINDHAFFAGFESCAQYIALQVFTIGDEHEDFLVVFVFLEQALGFANGAGEVGTLVRNHVGADTL